MSKKQLKDAALRHLEHDIDNLKEILEQDHE